MKTKNLRIFILIQIAVIFSFSIRIANAQQPSLNAFITKVQNVSCYGQGDGSITVSATGGFSPYTYIWSTSPGQTSQTATGLSADTYTVTVTDNQGGTVTASAVISQPAILSLDKSITNVLCMGGSNGAISITVSGGTGSNTPCVDLKSAARFGILAGVGISNNAGASEIHDMDVGISPGVRSSITGFFDVDGGPGLIFNGAFYASDDIIPPGVPAMLTQAKQDLTDAYLFAEAATSPAPVTVSGDQGGTTLTPGIYKSTSTLLIQSGDLTLDAQGNVNACWIFQIASGLTTVGGAPFPSPSGGNVILTNGAKANNVFWQVGSSVIIGDYTSFYGNVLALTSITMNSHANAQGRMLARNGAVVLTSTNIITRPVGSTGFSYIWSNTATTKNISGLTAGTYTVTVTDLNGCSTTTSATITQPPSPTVNATVNPICFGSSSTLFTTPAYSGYIWSNGSTAISITVSPTTNTTYTVTVTDNNGCTATGQATVSVPPQLQAGISSVSNITCFGLTNGSLTVTAVGGTQPYGYNWNTTPVQTTQTASGLSAGTFTVTVTDNKGCTATGSHAVSIPIEMLQLDLQSVAPLCGGGNNGTAGITVTGGTTPYKYKWNTNPQQTTQTAVGLTAGNYTVTVSDNNNCTLMASVTVTEPALLTAIASSTLVSCFNFNNGTASVTASGGSGGYTYLWNTIPSKTTQSVSGLSSSTYTVTVTDSKNCTATASTLVSQSGAGEAGPDQTICIGGSSQLNATGGVIYAWSPATGLSNPNIANPIASPTVTTTYTVTISNSTGNLVTNGDFSAGNTGFTSGYCTDHVNPLPCPATDPGGVKCVAERGLWPEGTYKVCLDAHQFHCLFNGHGHGGGNGTAELGGLFMALNGSTVAGTNAWSETVNVDPNTDYDFSAWISTLHLPEPFAQLRFSINGTLLGPIIQAPSDTVSYTQFFAVWNSGVSTTALIEIVNTDVVAGSNDFGLDDILFTTVCNTIDSVKVIVSNMTVNITKTPSCNGGSSGTATASVTGGVTPYSYRWSTIPHQTAQTATGLSSGPYTVTVSDAHNCTKTASVTISQAELLLVTASQTSPVRCKGENNGQATVTATGGVEPYSYHWNNGATTKTASGLTAGTYTVTVTDQAGCTNTANATVSGPAAFLVANTSTIPVSCADGSDGIASATGSGGNGGYTYLWNTIPESPAQTITGLVAGTYTVTVTDNKGCTATGAAIVTQPSLLTAIASSTLVSCFNFNNGTASVTPTGGNGGYTYRWSSDPVQTTQIATFLIAKTYTVTVTDSKNCTTTASTLVGQPVSPDAGPDQTICLGGSAQLDATGGLIYRWSPSTSLNNPDIANPVASPTVTTKYYVTITNPSGDLVLNGDFSGGLSDFSSDYCTQHVNPLPFPYNDPGGVKCVDERGLWPEGTFTVLSNPWPYHGGVVPFHGHDHTTGSGLFMAVNGSTTPGVVVWQENVTVKPNTTYDFITWIATIFENSPAELNFSINGTLLGPTITAPPDSNHWIQFYAIWNSGPSTSALIQIVNGNTIGFGNDFGLDDILFTTVCSNVDSLIVNVTHITTEISNSNVMCYSGNNGNATVTAFGGNGSYTYKWNTQPVQTTQTSTGLSAGTYTVTVTDELGCTGTASTTITQPPQITVNAGPDQVYCNASNTFLIGNDPAPGIGNWTMATGPNTAFIFPSNSSIAIAAGLIPGIYKFVYTITVSVPEGFCMNSDTMMVTNYHLPTPAFAGPDQQLCKTQAGFDSTLMAGNLPLFGSGLWTQMSGPNTANIVNPGNPHTKVKHLIDGIYIFRWSITSGICDVSTSDVQVEVHIMPVAHAGPNDTICGGSSFTLVHSSVSGDYTLLTWLTSGTGYFNDPNILHPTYVPSAADIAAGQVTLALKVTGYDPCGIVIDQMVLHIVAPPVANAGPDASICETSNFCLCGASAFNYIKLWWTTTGTGTFNDSTKLKPIYTPSPGDIAGGCVKLVLHLTGNPPCGDVTDTMELCIRRIPIVYAGPDTTICSQGTYTINLSTEFYATGLKWRTSGTGTFDNDTILHPTYKPGLADLAAGHVTLTLLGIACSPCPNDSDSMVLSFSYPPTPQAFVVTNVNCFGENNGSVTVTVTGGRMPYYYLWSDPAQQTTQTATGLYAGTYTVTVTDYYSCTATSSATVTEPPLLTALSTITHVSCYTYSDGSITLTANGGTPGYTYLWSTGATTKDISGLSADTYTVTVTDSHGCTATLSNVVTQPPQWGPPCITGLTSVCQGHTYQYCACPLELGFPSDWTFQWTVIGGTLVCCPHNHCITVRWDNCTIGQVCLLVTRGDGCQITLCINVTVNPVPQPDITGPAIVSVGYTGTYCTPDVPGDIYNWSVVGGTVVSGMGSNCIDVLWNTNCNMCQGLIIVNELNAEGCCGVDTLFVTILPGAGNLTGYVTYKNAYNTGLNGVSLVLRDSVSTIVGTTTTGPKQVTNEPGFYSFSNVPDGSYSLSGSFNGTWGGNNATDALIIELYTVHSYNLNGLNRIVGDVNVDLTVNSTDALWVKLRTVGMVNYYPAGDWKVQDSTFALTSSAMINLNALCEGDVNGSYIPTGFKEASFLSAMEDGTMTVQLGEPFDYEVRSGRVATLGAMTMFLGYDQSRFEVEKVVTELEGMKYLIRDGRLAFAWSNTNPMVVNDGDPIIVLRMKVKEPISSPAKVFEVEAGSEFAGMEADRFDNFDLRMSDLKTIATDNTFSLGNYPNPFSNTTTIVYRIPEQAHVKLLLMNMYGEVLHTLTDAGQAAGSYQVKVNPLDYNLVPGVYLYRIQVDGVTNTYDKINKMVFTR